MSCSSVNVHKTATCRMPYLATRVCTVQLGMGCVLVSAGGSTISVHHVRDVFGRLLPSSAPRGNHSSTSYTAPYTDSTICYSSSHTPSCSRSHHHHHLHTHHEDDSTNMDALLGTTTPPGMYAMPPSSYRATDELAHVVRALSCHHPRGVHLPHLIDACQRDMSHASQTSAKHGSGLTLGSANTIEEKISTLSPSQLQLRSGVVTCLHVSALSHSDAALGVVGTTAGTLLLFRIVAGAHEITCAALTDEIPLSRLCRRRFPAGDEALVDVAVVMDPAARPELVLAATASRVMLLNVTVLVHDEVSVSSRAGDGVVTWAVRDVDHAGERSSQRNSSNTNNHDSEQHERHTNEETDNGTDVEDENRRITDANRTPNSTSSFSSGYSRHDNHGMHNYDAPEASYDSVVKLVIPFPRTDVVRVLTPQRWQASFAMDVVCVVVLRDGVMYYVERWVKGGSAVHALHVGRPLRGAHRENGQPLSSSSSSWSASARAAGVGALDYGIMHRTQPESWTQKQQPTELNNSSQLHRSHSSSSPSRHSPLHDRYDHRTACQATCSTGAQDAIPHVLYDYRLSGVTVHLGYGAGEEGKAMAHVRAWLTVTRPRTPHGGAAVWTRAAV